MLNEEDFVKDFLKVELPDNITEVDENFRQHIFAQWLMNNHKTPEFDKLMSKFHKLNKEAPVKEKKYIDPTNFESVNSTVGELLTIMEYNKTDTIKILVPQALRLALFKGWEDQGFNFVRMLAHYGANS